MINLLSGEFYKLRKSKSFLACCMIIVLSVFLVFGMLQLANQIQQGNIENGTVGVMVEADVQGEVEEESIFENLKAIEIFQSVINMFIPLISVIFSAIFVIGEFGNGAIKNLAGKGYSRGKIFAAKYLVCMFAIIIMVLIAAIVTFVLSCIFSETNSLQGNIVRDYAIYTLLMSVLVVGINSIVVSLAQITRNLAAGISIGVCIVAGITSLLFGGLDLLLHNFSVKPSEYWLVNLMEDCPLTGFETEIVLRIVVSAIVWIGVAMIAGMWHFHKTDIK